MKIYFAASVTNTFRDIDLYNKIIKYLTRYGIILNKKIGDKDFWRERKKIIFSKEQAHDFDFKLLSKADVVIAEITNPSLGVGYEIGRAIERKKPVLGLYNKKFEKQISPMILGSPDIVIKSYKRFTDIKLIIDDFFNSL